ncbi:cyclin-dependent kinase inhibitor 1C isoform X2 [Notolabrus celidotus]|uniref:cyclin-dependent kinase inhibitor 1C isoform X2 n=2 Tax=Notolabrus celidotus TaxID=1203425 RepID=UPI0014905837|nr:cyclin-dependent kinase inhibitor 1C isoform X2 [Notolabrus celidotus]
MIRPELQELYQHYGLRMEETSQQENQELECKNPDEDQGGIRRRLRDRNLLRKRKAEAEAKETNQVESPRKRPRAENSGDKRRGRPRKNKPLEISFAQEETAVPQEAPAVLPVPAEVIPEQASGSLESQPTSVLAAPGPLTLFGSFQNPVFTPTLTSPALVDPTQALISLSRPAPSTTKVLDTAPVPVQEMASGSASAPVAVPVPTPDPDPVQELGSAPSEIPVPTAAPDPQSAPDQVETLYTGTQGKEALNQVIIEDLGPDEEEGITLSQENNEKDLSGTPSFTEPEQSKMFSVPTLSSQPLPPEYLPGNSL